MSILWPNLLSIIVLLAFVRQRWLRTRCLIEPGILFALTLLALYPLRTLILVVDSGIALPNYPDLLVGNNLERASWLATVGCVGFVFGYLMLMRRRKPTILQGSNTPLHSDDVLVCLLFFLGALVGITFKIATGDYISYLLSDHSIPALQHIGTMFADLEWPAYIGAWILWFRGVRKPGFLALFVSVLVVVVPYQFIQGSKTFLSLLLLGIALAHYWARSRLPKLTVLAGVAFVAFFVFPYVHAFREFINDKYGHIPDVSQLNFRGFRSEYRDDTPGSAVDELLAVSSRYGGVDELYEMTQVVPRLLPYRYGTEYGTFVVNFVPRAVWPDKPVFSRGAAYGAALNTITSVTPFPFGEAYWDFGPPGLFVGMTIWGLCLGAIVLGYERFFRKPGLSLFVGLYFLSQVYWITGSESSMADALSGLPQQIALLWFLYQCLRLLKPVQKPILSRLRRAA